MQRLIRRFFRGVRLEASHGQARIFGMAAMPAAGSRWVCGKSAGKRTSGDASRGAAAEPPNGPKLSDRATGARLPRVAAGVWPAGAVTRWSGSLQRVVRRRALRGAPSCAPERVPGQAGKRRAQIEAPPLTGSQPAGRTTKTLSIPNAALTPPNGPKLSDRATAARLLRGRGGRRGRCGLAGAVTLWSGSLQRVVRPRRSHRLVCCPADSLAGCRSE